MVTAPPSVLAAFVLCGALPLVLVPYVRSQRPKPGAVGLLVTISGLALWALATAAVYATESYGLRLAAMSVFLLGTSGAGIGYFLIATEYTGAVDLSRRLLAVLAVPAVAMQTLVWTEPFHGAVWAGGLPGPSGTATFGLPYYLHVVVTVGFAAAGLALIAREALGGRGVRRTQSLALVGAGLPPVALALFSVFVVTDLGVTIAPFGFVISVYLYAWALFRADVLEVAPVGRHRAVEEMDDAVVTLDAEGRVVDSNPAARQLSGVEGAGTGHPAAEFFAEMPAVADRLAADATGELTRTVDDRERHYHLDSSWITDATGRRAGRLVVLRDVTELKRRERTLAEREQELDLLRQVLSRALRHNIRNDLTVVRGYADAIATDPTADQSALADAIVHKCDDLVELSNKAATIERLITDGESEADVTLRELLVAVVDRYREAHPDVGFELDLPDHCELQVDASLAFAFENLIENAAEHGSTPSTDEGGPTTGSAQTAEARGALGADATRSTDRDAAEGTVRVDVTRDESTATVRIADDGPGIPAYELEVLERGEETPLEHGSGIGLWIVYWIVEHSNAEIDFESGDFGTVVTVEIPR